ncbi:MAG: hypothetical protein UV38_C0003G0252 [candidate division TM6 bacterium GW2011_GWE2_42_60]|nr:MAG: hypothetical protein UV38_C0003G0252 [candidate division TM6 bacterium GW2011_GWE2_42_60]HBY05871.1 hypothetical protein [Candidatus Dependentiae bacterium]
MFLRTYFFGALVLATPVAQAVLPILTLSEADNFDENSFSLVKKLCKKETILDELSFINLKLDSQAICEEGLPTIIKDLNSEILSKNFSEPAVGIGSSQAALFLRLWAQHHAQDFFDKKKFYPLFQFISVCGMQSGYYGIPGKKTHLNENGEINESEIEKGCAKNHDLEFKKMISQYSNTLGYFSSFISKITPRSLLPLAASILYQKETQDKYSFAGYWKDSSAKELYLKQCHLAQYNNEIDHPSKELFKKNLQTIQLLHFIGSSDDHIVLPWDSSIFCGFETPKTDLGAIVKTFKQTDQYKKNALGLANLLDSNRLSFKVLEAGHECHKNRAVAEEIVATIKKALALSKKK